MVLDRFRLDKKVSVVTGAARGIGLAVCEALGESGSEIILLDRLSELGEKASDTLREKGIQSSFYTIDVTDPDNVRQRVQEIVDRHKKIDILVNNAGVATNVDSVDSSDEDWLRILDVNLNGVYWVSRSVAYFMREQRSGSIVNLGSMSGIIVNKPQPQASYNASKSAVHQLTKSMACELAEYGVRVNAVAPGYVETDMTSTGRSREDWNSTWLEMTPLNRCAKPIEIASCILFLASEASSYVTGSILSVDGGYTAW